MPNSPGTTRGAAGVEYEYRVLTFRREVSRADIRRSLGEHAEYDHWELARTVVYVGGIRRAWLRRRVIRVRRTA
ncbi:MAG: DUF5703 family protein [Lapillicoccus sp.]